MASALRGGGGGGSAPAVLEAAASMQPGQGGQLEQGSTTTTLGGLLFRMVRWDRMCGYTHTSNRSIEPINPHMPSHNRSINTSPT